MAGNAGMHAQLLAAHLRIASGELRPALEIEIAKPIAGRERHDERHHNDGCQLLAVTSNMGCGFPDHFARHRDTRLRLF
jgi:hypothetical protein